LEAMTLSDFNLLNLSIPLERLSIDKFSSGYFRIRYIEGFGGYSISSVGQGLAESSLSEMNRREKKFSLSHDLSASFFDPDVPLIPKGRLDREQQNVIQECGLVIEVADKDIIMFRAVNLRPCEVSRELYELFSNEVDGDRNEVKVYVGLPRVNMVDAARDCANVSKYVNALRASTLASSLLA